MIHNISKFCNTSRRFMKVTNDKIVKWCIPVKSGYNIMISLRVKSNSANPKKISKFCQDSRGFQETKITMHSNF